MEFANSIRLRNDTRWQQQQAIPPRQKGKTYQAALAAAASNTAVGVSIEPTPTA